MKRSRFSETQIVSILKEADTGIKVADLCRKHGISQPTYYNWKSKYGGLSISELKRIKELEAEHSKFKRMYADLAMENDALKELLEKAVEPAERRKAVGWLVSERSISVSCACNAVNFGRSSWYRKESRAIARQQMPRSLMRSMRCLIHVCVPSGASGRLMAGWIKSSEASITSACGASTSPCGSRTKKRVPARVKQPLAAPAQVDHQWSMDFMQDSLYCGRGFRTLNLFDEGTLAEVVPWVLATTRICQLLKIFKSVWKATCILIVSRFVRHPDIVQLHMERTGLISEQYATT
ncbi:MAG: transposase [Verrucomicrobiae bacterium]|nr:transposase [Verrucomicrobiae bacterium]NNJ43858.1 transposase [Akkermansiaceae bacterium]